MTDRAFALAVLAALACVPAPAPTTPTEPAPADEAVAATEPLPEDEDGVIGGPVDASDFEFEPEVDDDGVAPIVDGAPTPELSPELAPYLDARRVKLAGVMPGGGMLVLGPQGSTTQALSIDQPGAQPRALTVGREPIVQVSTVPGRPNEILFRRDVDGSEDHQLFLRDYQSGLESMLTDGRSRHGAFRTSPGPLVVLTGNARSEPDMDLYVVSDSGPMLARELDGQWIAVALRSDGAEVLLRRFWSAERSQIFRYDLARERLHPLPESEAVDAAHVDARYAGDGSLLVVADRGDDHVGLHRLDAGGWTRVGPATPWDVEGVAQLSGGRIAWSINEDGRSRLFLLEPAGSVRELDLPRGGVLSGLRSSGSDTLAFTSSSAVQPADVYTLSVDRGELTRWTQSPTGADPTGFVHPRLARVSSSAGVQIPVFVYSPPGPGPHPVLLWMHGGPEDQFRPDFNPVIQYFVSRGVAILGPNVRGSDGYGRSFRGLDDGVGRVGAIEDVGAILDWVATEPSLDAERVGIYGASYGGYMVLASLVAYPERFVAGCDMVGMSNLVTFLENTRGYRQDLRRAEYGDEREPEARAALEQLSPLRAITRVRAPLFVAHGANDPRVPVAEAEHVVHELREQGREVWYMLAPNEGHAFRKRTNRDAFYALMSAFFERHLLGSGQPASPA